MSKNYSHLNLFSYFVLIVFLSGFTANAQVRTVTGKVMDAVSAVPLSGVTVNVIGKRQGTSTNSAGEYSVQAKADDLLTFNSVGYKAGQVRVGDVSVYNISLIAAAESLDSVVVIGYGSQRKRDITGSVTSLSPDDLQPGPAASFDQMMQGKVAGAQITQTSGAPGGNVNIVIRGINSITGGNQPLYVIDGYAIGSGGGGSDVSNFNGDTYSSAGMARNTVSKINPLSSINPADIASIEVLKDASATAIYGSRGANGVIIITTKKGRKGDPVVHIEAAGGFQTVANKLEMMSAREFAEFHAEGRDNAWVYAGGNAEDPNDVRTGGTRVRPEFRDLQSLHTNIDWQDQIFRNAPLQNYQLSTAGGGESVDYMVSLGYYNQQGIIKRSDFNKYNIRSNIDVKLSDRLSLGVSLAGSYTHGDFARAEGHLGTRGLIAAALANSPAMPIYQADGSYSSELLDPLGVPVENPYLILEEFSDKRNSVNIFSNNYLQYDILDGLSIKTSIGVNYITNATRLWKSSQIGEWGAKTSPATAGAHNSALLNWLNENTINYTARFGADHKFDAVAGFTAQKESLNMLQAGAMDFPTDLIPFLAGGNVNAGTNYITEWAMLSWLGRINYSFKNKWLLTGTVRKDGSSRFGVNNRWGTFPSASLGYRLSDEAFMKALSFVDELKIRASYGASGNNLIGNYAHIGLLGVVPYVGNGQPLLGVTPQTLANENLTWERSLQTNLGLDLTMFNNRINLTVDAYRNMKKDLLLNSLLPAATGFGSVTQNIGELENKGLEIALNTQNITGSFFQWNTNFNISFNRNKVLALNSSSARILSSAYQATEVGQPISSFFLLEAVGVFKNWDEVRTSALQHPNTQPGDIRFRDANGDGKITDDDKTYVGAPWPKYTFGFNNQLTYKNLSLGISLTGSYGQKMYFQGAEIIMNSAGVQNQLALVNDRWKSEAEPGNGLVPRAIRNDYARGIGVNSRYLFEASFVRIRNVNLAYKLPAAKLFNTSIPAIDLFADVSNVYTFTDYPGYDPEGSSTGDNIAASGIDYFSYPLPRTFTLGLRMRIR
ncbi:TonB-dependent receptor [Sphingobacterium olei]|uniref:TonB-dependent receptor n=1 Tax=Sphingobacterium olei TaxID=2571155 RepID=A0A4U0NYN0_9SPHI|nr:TonB-dependent receptor [Sphingobacterium olei]TJZ59925.1 TonB-dependent receptor [Sphingobacterium olei]